MQIPYLARHCRVVTFDGRGNGRSDRPPEPEAYREEEFAADALAVMDATATERAVLVSLSRGAERSLLIAANHPERVDRIGVHRAGSTAAIRLAPRLTSDLRTFDRASAKSTIGWGKWNRHYWVENYADFLEFFFSQMPHRAALHEAASRTRSAGASTPTPETLVATQLAPRLQDEDERA